MVTSKAAGARQPMPPGEDVDLTLSRTAGPRSVLSHGLTGPEAINLPACGQRTVRATCRGQASSRELL